MAGRILVTRPQPGAEKTAARLRRKGYEPVVCPLTEIRPLPVELPGRDQDAIAVTSVNTLRHAPEALLREVSSYPCFAVGTRTASAARDAGFRDVRYGGGNAAGLAALIREALPRGTRMLYLCGRIRRPEFERDLTQAGLLVFPVETYDTIVLQPGPDSLGSGPLEAALLYSAAASEALMRLIAADADRSRWAGTRFLCLSPRVAEPLKGLGAGDVRISAEPSEDALLMLLGMAG